MQSKAFSLNTNDLVNIVKGALLVGLAASLTYFGEHLSKVDIGPIGVMLVPVVSIAIDTFVKWTKGTTEEKK